MNPSGEGQNDSESRTPTPGPFGNEEALFDLASTPPAASDSVPSPDELQQEFSAYEIIALLGRGGMGAVYQARQKELDRFIALKLLPPGLGADPDFAARFRREARAMARLNHPNIITLYEFGQTASGRLYFTMEFVEGANLHDLIRSGSLDEAQALKIAAQICAALAYAHGEGIVHRDIKPANVMVDFRGRVKVADFGLARLIGTEVQSGLTMTGTVMGTLDYMAPEQRRGEHVDHRADIYALGVMFYEMLCREVPHGMFDPPSTRIGCDPRLDQIVARAMQNEPDRRFQSTQEMHAAVEAARTGVLVPAPALPRVVAVSPPRPLARPAPEVPLALPPRAKSRLPLYIGLAAAVLTLALGALIFQKSLYRKRPTETQPGTAGRRTRSLPPLPEAAWIDAMPALVARTRAVDRVGVQQTAEGIQLTGQSAITFPNSQCRDGAVRVVMSGAHDLNGVRLLVRRNEARGVYQAWTTGSTVQLQLFQNGTPTTFGNYHSAPKPAEQRDVTLELRIIGQKLTAALDGEIVAEIEDATLTEGQLGIGYTTWGTNPSAKGLIRSLHYQVLDAAPTAALEPSAIKLWDSPEKRPQSSGVSWQENALRLDNKAAVFAKPSSRNAILRARIRMNADAGTPQICVRNAGEQRYSLTLSVKLGTVTLGVKAPEARELKWWKLPRAYLPEEWLPIELRAEDSRFTVTVDGSILGTIEDNTWAGPGDAMVFANANGYFRDIVYVPLDIPTPPATSARGADATPTTVATPGEHWEEAQKVNFFGEGAMFQPTAGGFKVKGMICFPMGPRRDGAVRIRAPFSPELSKLKLVARRTLDSPWRLYQGYVEREAMRAECQFVDGNGGYLVPKRLRLSPLARALQTGEPCDLEFRVTGQSVLIRVNGQVALEGVFEQLAEGYFGIYWSQPESITITSVEYLNLDGRTAAEAPKPAAK